MVLSFSVSTLISCNEALFIFLEFELLALLKSVIGLLQLTSSLRPNEFLIADKDSNSQF
jgi:hypothetical protein